MLPSGVFGAKVGTKRLLNLFDQKGIKCSWYDSPGASSIYSAGQFSEHSRFIPAHTVETFPEEMVAIRDAGHEMCVLAPSFALHLKQ